MRSEIQQKPSPAAAYARAGEILSRRENRLTLIEGLILLFVLLPFHLTIKSVYDLALALWIPENSIPWLVGASTVYGLLTAALLVFLTFPAILGFIHMAGEMVRGEDRVPLITMFYPFSSGTRYSDILYSSSLLFGRVGIAPIVLNTCRQLVFYYAGDTLLTRILTGLGAILIIAGVLLWSLRHFSLTAKLDAVCEKEEPVFISVGGLAFRNGFAFFISYVPWLLLGTVTLGILILWDTLPRMAVAYFCYVEEIDELDRADMEAAELAAEDAMWVPAEELATEVAEPSEEADSAETASPEPQTNNMIQSEEDQNE